VNLLAELDEFVYDHRPHGRLTAGRHRARMERLPAHRGVPVRVVFERWVTAEDADRDLIGWARRN
jgi:hypothetical protein